MENVIRFKRCETNKTDNCHYRPFWGRYYSCFQTWFRTKPRDFCKTTLLPIRPKPFPQSSHDEYVDRNARGGPLSEPRNSRIVPGINLPSHPGVFPKVKQRHPLSEVLLEGGGAVYPRSANGGKRQNRSQEGQTAVYVSEMPGRCRA